MQLCRLAPPGTKPSAFASYTPWISPMNSRGDVAVEPRRPERVLHREDARREDHEVDRVDAGRVGRRLQHEEDRRIRMVVADRADRVEALEVVLVRRVVAVPRDDVERRVADARGPQVADELGDELEVALAILVARDRRQEVARVGEAVAADDAEVGQPERRAVVLAHVAARLAVGQLDGESARRAGSPRSRSARRRACPSSVAMRSRPCCGTISSSPSAS